MRPRSLVPLLAQAAMALAVLALAAAPAAAEYINIYPGPDENWNYLYDFGDVEVGSSGVMIFQIENDASAPSDLTVNNVYIETAGRAGIVHHVHPVPLGYGVVELGGGRRRLEDSIDPGPGFLLTVQPGDAVDAGTPLGTVHASTDELAGRGAEILRGAVEIGDGPAPETLPLVAGRIEA